MQRMGMGSNGDKLQKNNDLKLFGKVFWTHEDIATINWPFMHNMKYLILN